MEVEQGVQGHMAGKAQVEHPVIKKYPIAEIFTSPQGEGLYAGTMMTFVRVAGCSVGKKLPAEFYNGAAREVADANAEGGYRIEHTELPVYTEKCCTFDGRSFLCDTDFRTKEVLTAEDILGRLPVGVERLCITGGEPCMHDLLPLLDAAWLLGLTVHIETSGTILLKKYEDAALSARRRFNFQGPNLWLCCSPKNGFLEENLKYVHELKFLVDEHFDTAKVQDLLYSVAARSVDQLIWVQPINDEFKVNQANVNRCLEIMKAHPRWRLSTQGHKVWNVR